MCCCVGPDNNNQVQAVEHTMPLEAEPKRQSIIKAKRSLVLIDSIYSHVINHFCLLHASQNQPSFLIHLLDFSSLDSSVKRTLKNKNKNKKKKASELYAEEGSNLILLLFLFSRIVVDCNESMINVIFWSCNLYKNYVNDF